MAVASFAVLVYFAQTGYLAREIYELNVRHLTRLEPAPTPALTKPDFAFVDVSVLSMADELILAHQTVLVRDGRITEIGNVQDVELANRYSVINGSGAYLMPGLADMHVHFYGMPSELLLMLANGVTAVRIMAGQEKFLNWRERIQDGQILGPSLYVAGPILRGSASSRSTLAPNVVLQTSEQAIAEVERQATLGFDLIKPYTWISREVFEAAARVSKELGMPVAGHIPYSVGLDGVIAAGQREVTHVHEFNKFFFVDFDKDKRFSDWPIDESKMPVIVATVKKAFAEAGVSLVLGTDSGYPGLVHGFAVHEELVLLSNAGLSPFEALETATRNAARLVAQEREWGTIDVGMRADLLLLEDNPLTSITNTRKILGVMKSGQWFDRADLDDFLHDAHQERKNLSYVLIW